MQRTDNVFSATEPKKEELVRKVHNSFAQGSPISRSDQFNVFNYQQLCREKDAKSIDFLRNRLVQEMSANASKFRKEAEDILNKLVKEDAAKKITKTPLPNKRAGYNQKLKLNGQTLYLRTGEYEDGRLGEIYCDIAKQGSFIRSMLSAFCIAISVGLQHGVPLEDFADHFIATKFEPGGMVQNHERIAMASSILDLIFKDLAIHYLGREELANKGKVEELEEDDFNPENLAITDEGEWLEYKKGKVE